MRTSVLFLVFTLGTQLSSVSAPAEDQQQKQPRTRVTSQAPRTTDAGRLAQVPGTPTRTSTVVPDLSGLQSAVAARILTQSRLQAGQTELRESDRPKGTILDQKPAAGMRVPIGTRIDILVSKGRQQPPDDVGQPGRGIAVPNVVGESVSAARAILEKHALRLGEVRSRQSAHPRGLVIDQRPRPREEVTKGSAVDVLVSEGQPPVIDTTEVPAVVGDRVDDAAEAIRRARLIPQVVRTLPSRAAAGVVVNQEPVGGTRATAGSAVGLIVSAGEPLVTVPHIVNSTLAAAGAALADARLRVGDVSRQEASAEAGLIVAQRPEAGERVPPRTAVRLVVSVGPAWTVVPDLSRSDQRTAMRLLSNANLQLGTVRQRESGATPGLIVEQSQPPGARIRPGSTVDVVVSVEPKLAVVPDVVNRSEREAGVALNGSRLTVGAIRREESMSVPTGLVISQRPAPGSRVPRDTAVQLVVSSGLPAAIVPDVANRPEREAGLAINASRLTLGTIRREESTTIPAGQVISQTPAAGARVPQGTAVQLVVSSGLPATVVPDVVGSTRDGASKLLAAAYLQVGRIEERVAPTGGGVVLAQNVAPGTQVPRGTPIGFVVSSETARSNVPGAIVPPPRGSADTPPPIPPAPPQQPPDRPVSPQNPWPLPLALWPALTGAAAMGALYGLRRLLRRRKSAGSPDSDPVDQPSRFTLLPQIDPGRQAITLDEEAGSSIELCFRIDPGVQAISEEAVWNRTEASHDHACTDAEGSLRARPIGTHRRAS